MKKNFIHIFGAAGSGTTTLGKELAKSLSYYFMDTDEYYWSKEEPLYTKSTPYEERIKRMRKEIDSHENVVLSGSLVGWGDVFIDDFTLVIRLDTDKDIRIKRIEEREKKRFGDRILPGGDRYEYYLDFIEWAYAYDEGNITGRSRPLHDEWEKKLKCKELTLDGSKPLEELINIIKKEINL